MSNIIKTLSVEVYQIYMLCNVMLWDDALQLVLSCPKPWNCNRNTCTSTVYERLSSLFSPYLV